MQIDDKTARLLAERHFNKEPTNDWAIKCLEQGYDSPRLRIVAGMSSAYSPSEFDAELKRALLELGWAEIPPYVYLMQYARILADEIVNGKTDAIEGSSEIYKILQATDAHAELGAWYEIDEMIWDQKYYEKTGEKGYFYIGHYTLISEIKEACAQFLKRTEHHLGPLPETSFDEAEEIFKEFLKNNGVNSDLKWVFSEDVIIEGRDITIRVPLPEDNRERAEQCFNLGKKRNFGLAFLAFCTLGNRPCCYIQLPENELDAQYKLMSERFVKFSCRIGMPEAKAIRNSAIWKIRQLFANRANGYDEPIPSRTTLLPFDYEE